MILHPHLNVNEQGHLTIGGVDTVELAREFGTPAYVLDVAVIRENCRTYRRAATEYFGADALPLYASKALCFAGIYRIAAEEGMGVDCVSGGELYTAKAAGFPAEKIYFRKLRKKRYRAFARPFPRARRYRGDHARFIPKCGTHRILG